MTDVKKCFWNEPMETMSRTEIGRLQEEALPERIEKARREAPLYRELWESSGLGVGSCRGIEDLAKFPFVVKDMVRDFRRRTRDPFGGIAAPVRPGSTITRSTGTSGDPTFFVMSPDDVDRAADEVASYLWQVGHRPGSLVMVGAGSGTRADAPMWRAHERIGVTTIAANQSNVGAFLSQLEYLAPESMGLVSGALDRLVGEVAARGQDLREVASSVQRVTHAGRRLSSRERCRISALLGADVFEVGGLGDIGFWGSDCVAHQGIHIREDFFVIETVDPVTGELRPNGELGELVFTSLWEESMNYVRWRSEDLGIVDASPCSCGRTTARVRVLGRVSERVDIGDRVIFPGDVEDALLDLFEKEPSFQLVKDRETGRLLAIKIALEDGLSAADAARVLQENFSLEVEVRAASDESIRAGSPDYKYRQVVYE